VVSFSSSTTIARSVEDVFAVVTNVENTGRWFPGDVREFWTTPPPHGVGSVRRAVVTVMGRQSENDATVTEFDPPHRGVLAGQAQGMQWTGTIECQPVLGGTKLDFVFDGSASGVMRLFFRPLMSWYSRSWETGLANLKRMMEAGEL
jgi:uncharacterized protein YndB with AHSA1/START domain